MSKCNYARITPEQFRQYLPPACAWALEQEQFVREKGIPLTAPQLSDAGLAGVAHPEWVRLLCVEQIPTPEHPVLRAAAEATSLITSNTPGLPLRYGIFIRSDRWEERRVLVHALAHTAQFERLGSIPAFLECYLFQCFAIGYPSAPMEQEALAVEQRICGPPQALSPTPAPSPPIPTDQSSPTHSK